MRRLPTVLASTCILFGTCAAMGLPAPAEPRALGTSAPAWPRGEPATLCELAGVAPAAPDLTEAPEAGPPMHLRRRHAIGLDYLEVVLGTDDPDAALPLVLLVHGLGDRPRVPERPFYGVDLPMRLVMPRAPAPMDAGFSWLPVRVADGETARLSAALRAAADHLASFVDEVKARHPTEGPTVVAGFSQGGLMAFALAVRHPGRVDAAFPLAGWLPPPLWPSEPAPEGAPPIRALHGARDARVPIEPTREAVQHLAAKGFDVTLAPFPGAGHEMTPEMEARFHEWLVDTLLPATGQQPEATTAEATPSRQPPGESLRDPRGARVAASPPPAGHATPR